MLITRLRMEAKSRSWFADLSACLGLLALLGVACFHYPDLLTSPGERLDRDAIELGPYEVVHVAA